jgi:abortive infection bacteriophage resistance protein
LKYTKPPLTFKEQVDLLLDRGMVGESELMEQRLSTINYYRLSGYWFHYLDEKNHFRPGTRFEDVWLRYVFDRKLRLIVMDAVERIEIDVRTLLSYHFAHAHGPFAYATEESALPALDSDRREDLLLRITQEVDRSKREQFVKHFESKYGDEHNFLPIWMAVEVMSFGSVLGLLKACSKEVKKKVARPFDVSDSVLLSWLWSLNEVRNICAHHGRLWNRPLGNKPMIPFKKHHPAWHQPVTPDNTRIFCVLTLCAHSLSRISPGTTWPRRLRALLYEHERIPRKNMGFPEEWLKSPLWRDAT